MTQQLIELAERCEKAEGPDRELDAEIYCAINDGHSFIKMAERGDTWGDYYGDGRGNTLIEGAMLFERTDHDGSRDDDRRIGGRFQQFPSSPDYTASLDAAMTLVPEGLEVQLTVGPLPKNGAVAILLPERRGNNFVGHANSPALALCAAALRARAAS